jgi:hypothetical protein
MSSQPRELMVAGSIPEALGRGLGFGVLGEGISEMGGGPMESWREQE